ncbi:MAG: hypothetical protein WBX15_10250 [Thermoanaerobaculia bacterium]
MSTGRFLLVLLSLLIATAAQASELSVTPRQVEIDGSVTITVSLDGAYADLDHVQVPLKNLRMEGGESRSTRMEFGTGGFSHTTVFQYIARPIGAGDAVVGPVRLVEDGHSTTLPAVRVAVVPAPRIDARDPIRALRELAFHGRRPLLLVAHSDRTSAYVGQPVEISWWIWAGVPMRAADLSDTPDLQGFWVEEIPVPDEVPRAVSTDAGTAVRVLVRRATLYPVHSGELTIPPITADVVTGGGPGDLMGFSIGERNRIESKPLTIEVRDLPQPADLVGSASMRCSTPRVSNQGLVSFDLVVRGEGNLRMLAAPAFPASFDVEHQVEDQGTKSRVASQGIEMERRWRYLLFPATSGPLRIPPLALTRFDPATGKVERIRCTPGSVDVPVVRAPAVDTRAPSPRTTSPSRRRRWLWIAIAALFVIVTAAVLVLFRRKRARIDTNVLDGIVRKSDSPRDLRREIDRVVSEAGFAPERLFSDPSDLGECFRAIHSWVDVIEKEPHAATDRERVLRDRAFELLRQLERRGEGRRERI